MPNINLIAELQAIQTAGTAGWKGLSSASPKARLMIRKAEQVYFPQMPVAGIDNNIALLAGNAVANLQAGYW